MSQAVALLNPPSASVTAEELWRDWSDVRCELVRGEVIPLSPPSIFHAQVSCTIATELAVFLRENPLGRAYVGDGGFILARNPDTVRGADVAFLTTERAALVARQGYAPFAPDLVVEVVSPNDTYTGVTSKAADWLAAGTRLVWVVDPERQTVEVRAPGKDTVTLRAGDVLTGGEVLPGFSVPVERLFG